MWSNNIDLKINVCITQHTQALRERTLSEGTRITPRTPKRLAVPRLHCGGVCERQLALICILQQKEKRQNIHASIETFLTLMLCLIGRWGSPAWADPAPAATGAAFPSRSPARMWWGAYGTKHASQPRVPQANWHGARVPCARTGRKMHLTFGKRPPPCFLRGKRGWPGTPRAATSRCPSACARSLCI